MTKLSFLDKITILFHITKSSKIFLVVIIFLIFMGMMFLTTNRKNAKSSRILYLVIYSIILGFLLWNYHTSLINMFDYMMNNFFIMIYFPNLAIYLAAIIASNIIIWITTFNFKIARIIKRINTVAYCILTYLLVLILVVVNDNKLDVFTQASVYGNQDALALIELSSMVFIIWILFLIIYKLIRMFQKKNMVKKPKEIVSEEEKLYRKIPFPYVVKSMENKPQFEKEKTDEELLTVDDYKAVLTILEDHKKQEHEEVQIKQESEQSKFEELQALYRV